LACFDSGPPVAITHPLAVNATINSGSASLRKNWLNGFIATLLSKVVLAGD
jgi:hypothetical protein